MRKREFILIWIIVSAILNVTGVADAEILTVADGLKLAQENSRLIKIIERDENIAEADIMLAKSRMLPFVDSSMNQTFLTYQPKAIFGPTTVPLSEKTFFSYSLNIQQTLYDFKANASRYEASKIIFQTKKFDTQRVRNLVGFEFLVNYTDILESEKLILVAEKEVERLQSHHRIAEVLYTQGVITKNDLLQAEVRISDAKQRLLTVRNYRALAASHLNNILARPLNTEIETTDFKEIASDIINMDMGKIWELAEIKRPELQIVNETLNVLNLEQKSKKAEYYPKFYVAGGYDYNENRYQVHESNWSLNLGMNVIVFNGFATKAELIKLEQQKFKLLEQKNKLIDEIKLEIAKYILDSRTAQERVSVTENAVQQAEENLRIYRVMYEKGSGISTDVLDAVTLLTVAETNYYKAVYDLRKAEAGVMYSIGTELSEAYE
ncbi:MAG: hypothetical protein A2161_11900 [Candidatus Schekmanbacteria bacterium RBG_13_48_7]|uniref:Transporter n=1 Tax=Candidatus Schekmanbacteria bacterium RBG_13_48_7 TaxID=1817878 RepID=A0A1F7S100_9BACT|nr:MAG: hypothetical protein A2161_11900 [Candidatus Schekmanbacteria bacterium RBG_13_48_7]